MSKLLIGVICGVAGALIGSAVTYVYLTKQATETEEVTDIIAHLTELNNENQKKKAEANMKKPQRVAKEEVLEFATAEEHEAARLANERAANMTDEERRELGRQAIADSRARMREDFPREEGNDIHLIAPEEFGEDPTYDVYTWILHDCGTLANEQQEQIHDAEIHIGIMALDSFENYENEDAVYVINETERAYYEVLKSNFSYEEVMT